VTDTVSGAATGTALDLSVLGRGVTVASTNVSGLVDSVASTLNATAEGLGTALSPATHVTGVLNGGEQKGCATAPLTALLNQVQSTLQGVSPQLAAALPNLRADIACGTANIFGNVTSFTSEGTGSVAEVKVALAPAVQALISQVHSTLDSTIAATPLKDVLASTDAAAVQAVQTVNGLLSNTLGLGVQLPVLVPTQTVGNVLDRLADTDLVRISIGKSLARNVGDDSTFSSLAHDDAGKIEILPEFRGPGLPALVTIKVAESEAAVNVVRNTTATTTSAKNTIVRIESELLPDLSLSALGLGNTPLSVLTDTLGYKAGPGFIEVSPGKDLTILAGTPLESTISVSKVTDPEVLPNGRTRVTASAATIHLFKGLNDLVPGVNLGTILADPTIDNTLHSVAAALPAGPLKDLVGGLTAGQATGIPGIKLEFAKAQAEAGAVRVKPATVTAVRPTSLPRTGGTPVDAAPYAVPALLGAAGGLRMMIRRRRAA
jgi:hypothetical protein